MRLVEITALPNGGHRNQTPSRVSVVPNGWAVVPADLETPNFPFGEIVAAEIDGVMTVTSWTPGVVPEPVPPSPVETVLDATTMAMAITEGVNAV